MHSGVLQQWAAICLLSAAAVASAGPAAPPMQRHLSQDPAFVLYRPADWVVRAAAQGGALQITVASPDGASGVVVEYADNRQRRLDAVGVLAAHAAQWRARHPDLRLSEVNVCREPKPSCAAATVSWRAGGVQMAARWFAHGGPELAVLRAYRAPADRLAAERTRLLDVLTNIEVQGAQPLAVQWTRRRAPDGSLALDLPADWRFAAGRGAVLAGSPQGRAGFVATVFQVMPSSYGVVPPPGVLVSPYRPPPAHLQTVFASFGNRDLRIHSAVPDLSQKARCVAAIGRACEAADLTATWVSPEGVACAGGFRVITFQPNVAGQWFSQVYGIWGPAGDLARWIPVLHKVAESYAIDDAYAKGYIAAGMARVREMERQTRSAVQGLYAAIEDNQRAYEQRTARREASEARWDDYRRGNSYWISDIEGGKVYQSDPWGLRDTRTGDRLDGPPHNYIHFEGDNPRHPSERMREISSDEVRRLGL